MPGKEGFYDGCPGRDLLFKINCIGKNSHSAQNKTKKVEVEAGVEA